MTNRLHIATDLSLPLEYITTTSAILAKKRVGKTYLAQKIAEGLLAAGQQVVVIDMTSAWWGLRSSADGKSPGYPITIFGGRHGDVPLEATAGEMLAEAIVADRFSAVLDVRLLKKGQRIRFIADFLEALYDKNTTAMHLFMDEADAYIPQRSFSPEEARALGAADELVRRGGIGGIGVTMITQRAAVLNKNVLSQVDTLSILRMNHPKDIDSVTDWMEHHTADKKLIADISSSLSSLARGEAWWLDPEHKTFKRITVSPKVTYDSGRTPKVGEQIKAPKVLAKVDLERLGSNIAATVERAKANDPKALKARIAELEKQVAAKAPMKAETKVVEKPVIADAQIKRMENAIAAGAQIVTLLDTATEQIEERLAKQVEKIVDFKAAYESGIKQLHDALRAATSPQTGRSGIERKLVAPQVRSEAPRVPPRAVSSESGSLPVGEASTLRALIQYPDGLDRSQLTVLTGYKRSTRDAYIARLRERGLVETNLVKVFATEAGRSAMPDAEPLPTGEELQSFWLYRLPEGERAILSALIEAHPENVSRDQLSETTGYKRSTRDAYLSRLAAKELVTGRASVKASDTLFEVGS